ncbi:hypothetical protein R0131_15600 [Clostridium sp. AL.422]|uniref:hypothetical protein n=1 Tax=Clostridium TaxID=1485 RepID=UPI00293DE425|nr:MULTISPECIES: hypothetical protein [unclassified Clostridium]MDV4152252.1 hypothetical protein [Clostridium sp. AL.422]
MFNKSYFSNMPPKNVIREDNSKNLSEELFSISKDDSLDNMILNSNLDNQNIIK